MSQQLAERFVSMSFYENEKFRTHFDDLPEEARKNILSRLPVIDIMRCRGVCTIWKAMLSPSSSASLTPESSDDFFRNFRLENRPTERWLFLHNESLFNKSLLYDVDRHECHDCLPKFDVHHLRIRPQPVILNTTTSGLIFVIQHVDTICLLHMWTYNPLTHRCSQLPDISCSLLMTVVASRDITTSTLDPHYKVLLLQKKHFPPAAEEDRQFKIHLYSSRHRTWVRHENIRINHLCILREVKRFYEHDLIYFLETPNPLTRLLYDWPPFVDGLCHLRWFSIQDYTWNWCPLSPPGEIDVLYELKYFFLLERKGELFLLAALANEDTLAVEIRVYKSSSTITAGNKWSWTFLSSMPRDLPYCAPPTATATAESSLSQFGSESKIYAQVFPSPGKEEGDKLIIIFMGHQSYNRIVSFDLESPAESGWRSLVPTGHKRNEHTPRRSSVEEKIVDWSKFATAKFRARTVLPYHDSIFESGSVQGFAFDPRFEDL